MMKIDMRPAETQGIKKVILHMAGGSVFVDIIGMNPLHAAAEIEAVGGKVLSMDAGIVGGYIYSDAPVKLCESLLANGWEWKP